MQPAALIGQVIGMVLTFFVLPLAAIGGVTLLLLALRRAARRLVAPTDTPGAEPAHAPDPLCAPRFGPQAGRPPYRRAGPLLTPTEALFLPVLRRAAGSCPVLCKVRLADVAEPTGQDARRWGLVMRQHLDFVVVDPASWRVLCAVELDDPSHDGFDARRRDGVKGQALSGAGVPLLRVRTAGHYDAGEIAARLSPVIAAAGLGQIHQGQGLSGQTPLRG